MERETDLYTLYNKNCYRKVTDYITGENEFRAIAKADEPGTASYDL